MGGGVDEEEAEESVDGDGDGEREEREERGADEKKEENGRVDGWTTTEGGRMGD